MMAELPRGLLVNLLKIRHIRQTSLKVAEFSTANDENVCGQNNVHHVYKRQYEKSEIIDRIVAGVVHKTDDFVATCKPYGIGQKRSKAKLEDYVPNTVQDFYLDEMLPELSQRLGYNRLNVAKTPERFASGVMFLSATEKGKDTILKGLLTTVAKKEIPYTYTVITSGQPIHRTLDRKFGLSCDAKNAGTVLDKWSNNEVKKSLVSVTRWKHRVVSQSDLASLVEIQITRTHKNLLKLILATKCFSPVLGDHLMSRRLVNVFGVPLLKDPKTSTDVETFNSEILERLELRENEWKLIPSLVHLTTVRLMFSKNAELTVSVPPPQDFLWTCEKLGLKLDESNRVEEISDS